MAEFVQKKVEDMRSVLEQMKKLNLFTEQEICGITRNLKEHEYKLQRHTKSKEDYLQYIQYQMDLLKLVKQRREKYGIMQTKCNIDFTIANKINQLYKDAILKFQDDVRFWIAYMTFCKFLNFHSCINQMIGRMLSVHQDKPKCWHAAAHWEIEENNNLQNARKFLLRGLHLHPDSQLLYMDIFKLELDIIFAKRENLELNNTFIISKSMDNSKILNEMKTIFIIYEQAIKRIRNIKFLIELLKIAEQYEMTKQLQNRIISDLVKEYPHDPVMWDTMARRELKGFIQPIINIIKQPVDVDDSKQMSLRNRISNCYEVYQTAVKTIKNEEMWSLFLDCMLEINQDINILPNFKRKLLKNALLQGHHGKKLKEKYYLYWIQMINFNGKSQNINVKRKLYDVMCWATEALPESESLWYARLNYLLNTSQEEMSKEVFNKAIHNLGNHSLSLWQLRLLHIQAKNPENLEKFFHDALSNNPVVSNYIKPIYMEYIALTEDIHTVRKIYHKLYLQLPPCLELHKKMISLELLQPDILVQEVRKTYEISIFQFGKENINVWLDYIVFEMTYGETSIASSIYNRAVNTLKAALVENFVTEFSLFKANFKSL